MKKVFCIALMLLGAVCLSSAKIVSPDFEPFSSPDEFVAYSNISGAVPYDVPEECQQEVSVNQAFKVKFNGCDGEVRYSLFKETGMNDKADITIYESLILMGLAGTKMRVEKRGDFKALVVRKNFNADEGSFVSVISPNSAYASGYKYMEVEFFYKNEQGICVRTFLYNDPAFIGEDNKNESEFYKNYASFKFMKKKRNGSYKRS